MDILRVFVIPALVFTLLAIGIVFVSNLFTQNKIKKQNKCKPPQTNHSQSEQDTLI